MHGVGNYFSAASDPTNPNSLPAFDQWGPDFRGYWSLADWMTWHQALVAAVGRAQANATFTAQWNSQSAFAAPVNEIESDVDARAYFQSAGLLPMMNSLKGAATDVTSTIEKLAASLSSASNLIVPALLFVGVLWLLPSPQKVKSARALFGK